MKKAIDLNGFEVVVSLDTTVKTIDGVHYLLTDEDSAEIAARESDYDAKAPDRALQKVLGNRRKEYGNIESQIEFITENGLEAWQAKVAQIKANNPK